MNAARHEVVVRFRDLDALGHVNYSVYLNYLEDALNRLWVKALAAVDQVFDPQNPGIVSVRAEINYRASALCDQTLAVDVWITRIANTSFTASYRITEKATERLIADATTTQVVRLRGEEDRRMPNNIRSVLEGYLA
jgi:acyl-CoA thioester hydrolase